MVSPLLEDVEADVHCLGNVGSAAGFDEVKLGCDGGLVDSCEEL